jgi:hypothetical protein
MSIVRIIHHNENIYKVDAKDDKEISVPKPKMFSDGKNFLVALLKRFLLQVSIEVQKIE